MLGTLNGIASLEASQQLLQQQQQCSADFLAAKEDNCESPLDVVSSRAPNSNSDSQQQQQQQQQQLLSLASNNNNTSKPAFAAKPAGKSKSPGRVHSPLGATVASKQRAGGGPKSQNGHLATLKGKHLRQHSSEQQRDEPADLELERPACTKAANEQQQSPGASPVAAQPQPQSQQNAQADNWRQLATDFHPPPAHFFQPLGSADIGTFS